MSPFREALSDNFEGSSFAWTEFKRNPVLSILGIPLVLADAMLLPVRAIVNRKDFVGNDTHYRPRAGPSDPFLRSRSRDTAPHFGEHYFPPQAYPLVRGPIEYMELYRRHNHRTPTNKRRDESVLYPGWRFPRRGFGMMYGDGDDFGLSAARRSRQNDNVNSSATSRSRQNGDVDFDRRTTSQRNSNRASSRPSTYTQPGPDHLAGQLQDEYQAPTGSDPWTAAHRSQQAPMFTEALPAQPMQMDYDTAYPPRSQELGAYDDFPAPVADFEPPTGTAPHAGNLPPDPKPTQPNDVRSSQSRHQSRDATQRGGTQNNIDSGSGASFADTLSSAGRDRIGRWNEEGLKSEDPWKPSPSSIHTRATPTNKDGSVEHWDSASYREGEEPQVPYVEHARSPDGSSKASSGRNGKSTGSDRVSNIESRGVRSEKRGSIRTSSSAANPPRAHGSTFANTTDQPKRASDTPRSRSKASRPNSQQTSTTESIQREHEPMVEEPESEDERYSYCDSCNGPRVGSEYTAPAELDARSEHTHSSGNEQRGMSPEAYAPEMEGLPTGMQAPNPHVPRSQQSSRSAGSSRHSHSRSTSSSQR